MGKAPFFVGHKSLNTTIRYIKIEDKEQAEALDRWSLAYCDRLSASHGLPARRKNPS